MFGNPSVMTRIAVGKAVGLALGAIGFGVLQFVLPDIDAFLPWAVLLWYTTLGAIIGVYGVIAWHPILQLPAALVGARAAYRRLDELSGGAVRS